MAFGKFGNGGPSTGKAYDSVKQSLPNTTNRSKAPAANMGQNTKPPSVVETSTAADRPIFMNSKKA